MTNHPGDSDPVRRVLDRLAAMGKVVRWAGSQHLAQCPGHDDDGPSLAIREGTDCAVLNCHAGCNTEDVVHAMGMNMRDLFVRRSGSEPAARNDREAFRPTGNSMVSPLEGILAPQPGGNASGPSAGKERRGHLSEPIATATTTPAGQLPVTGAGSVTLTWVADYIYQDASGTPTFKIARYAKDGGGKSFFQFRRDQGMWSAGLNGRRPPLYHLPEVLAAVAAGMPVLVVEGEKDADRAMRAGAVATTSSGGAGKWQPEHTAALAGAQVIVLADDDAPGRAHAVSVYTALQGVAKHVQVFLPATGCKDLSEQLEAGYDLFSFRPFPAAELAGEPGAAQSPHLGLTPASAVSIVRVRWGWRDRMPIGELTLIPGREGVGKSLFLAWLAAQLTLGTLPGEFHGTPRSVLYVASEDSWAYTVAPRLKAAGADLERVYRIDVLDGGRLVLPADCELIPELATSVGAAALMLDPVISLINDNLSVNQASELRRALEPLRKAAERAEIIVPALAHFNKTTDTDVLSKIPGSRAWAEVARAAFGVAEDREGGGYVASQIKNNLGRVNLPNLSYRIEGVLIEATDGQADVGRLVWTGESDVGIEEVLGRRPDKRARETSETTNSVVEFVAEAGYPIAIADVYAQFPEIQRGTVRQVLRRAVERGTLSSPLHGHYQPGSEGVTHATLSP